MPEPFRSVCGRCRVCGGVLRKHDGQVHGGPFVSHRPQWFPFDVGQLGRGGDRAPHLCDRVHLVTCSGCSPGGIPLTGLGGGAVHHHKQHCVRPGHTQQHACFVPRRSPSPGWRGGRRSGGPGGCRAVPPMQCGDAPHATIRTPHAHHSIWLRPRTRTPACARHTRARPHACVLTDAAPVSAPTCHQLSSSLLPASAPHPPPPHSPPQQPPPTRRPLRPRAADRQHNGGRADLHHDQGGAWLVLL
jgi:hypothetical protein